ncbi:MAG: hypothetical protein MJH10_11470 [Epibacterium sp.]|nr:hypothetical protein [Epibacterium sp.]NQX74166.1 hypothetical protein [Epibacterium sp.]
MTTLMTSKTIQLDGFTVTITLTDLQCGLTDFNNKWTRDVNGKIAGRDGDVWDCEYFSIGQLNKGNDVTVTTAQKEFDRDCHAFDVALNVSISKCDVSLFDEDVIGSDYNYNDKETPSEVAQHLYDNYANINSYIESAQNKLAELFS